jgi:hypothetical protein
MAELSKFFKIVLIIDIIAAFFWGIIYLLATEDLAGVITPSTFYYWRLWGVSCTTLGVFGIIGFIRNEWTTIKAILEFVSIWVILANVISFISLADTTSASTTLSSLWTDWTIIVLIVLNIYAYLRENKQYK